MIVILNYNIGNLSSIKNMLKKGGITDVLISDNPEDINKADKLILPGVGHFDYGMSQLRNTLFFDLMNKRVLEDKVPVLGVCLGAQLLTESSEEGSEKGLGWIKAKTRRFQTQKMATALKVPHMGWSDVHIQKQSRLFEGMEKEENRFYFVHTYHVVCEDATDELVRTHYGYDFTAGIERENVVGVQFHPEKSHKFGMRLLYNFAKNY